MVASIKRLIKSSEEMEAWAKEVLHAARLESSLIIFLEGELGAGKTTWVRGFLRALDYQGAVKSPTYTLVEPYDLAIKIYHFDLYRLSSPEELELMGIRDYFHEAGFCLIEWASKGEINLPIPDLKLQIEKSDSIRIVTLQAYSKRGQDVLASF